MAGNGDKRQEKRVILRKKRSQVGVLATAFPLTLILSLKGEETEEAGTACVDRARLQQR